MSTKMLSQKKNFFCRKKNGAVLKLIKICLTDTKVSISCPLCRKFPSSVFDTTTKRAVFNFSLEFYQRRYFVNINNPVNIN
jgi:hypothetical protein